MGTNILNASAFGDIKHHETAQAAESIEKADGFAQVFRNTNSTSWMSYSSAATSSA